MNQNNHCMQEILKQDILKEDCQKPSKKRTLFFLSNPVSLTGQDYENLKGA